MNGQLMKRISHNAGITVRGGTLRIPRALPKAAQGAGCRGLVSAAMTQAAGYLTHVALSQVAMLTAKLGRMVEQCPLGEGHFKAIVDTFTGAAASEIARGVLIMEVLAIFLIIALAAACGTWAMFEYRAYTQPERERTLSEELDALRAAQRLSLAAWQAHRRMADIVRGHDVDGS